MHRILNIARLVGWKACQHDRTVRQHRPIDKPAARECYTASSAPNPPFRCREQGQQQATRILAPIIMTT